MTRTLSFALVMATAWVGASRPASAQSVSDVLRFLVTNNAVETGSVERDAAAAEATSATISRALLANLSTLPVTSSSGAFVYRLNPVLGTVQRSTKSFGPFFIERALTTGSRGASVGLALQHMRFSTLDGRDLRNGSMITTANRFLDEADAFDVDQLTLDLDVDLATLYGNLGIGDRLEVGAAVPFMSLRLDGRRVNTYREQTFTQSTASSTAVGLADVIVRAKYQLFQSSDSGISWAAAVDARLPTGREEDLLGTGKTSMRVAAIGSLEDDRVSTHANVGLTVGGIAREFSYGGAVTFSPHDRMTLSGELLGRWMNGIGRIRSVAAPHPALSNVETIRLASTGDGLNLLVFAPGFKFNLTNTWLFVGNVSVPLSDRGLTTRFTPFVGFDYAIER